MNETTTAQAPATVSRDYFVKPWTVRCTTSGKNGKKGKSFRIFKGPTQDSVRFEFPEDFDSEHQWHLLEDGTFDLARGVIQAHLDGYDIEFSKGASGIDDCLYTVGKSLLRCRVSGPADTGQEPGEFGAEEGG